MQLLLGALVRQSSLLTHCGCSWGLLEGRVLNYDVVRKILYERIIKFSPKMRIFEREMP